MRLALLDSGRSGRRKVAFAAIRMVDPNAGKLNQASFQTVLSAGNTATAQGELRRLLSKTTSLWIDGAGVAMAHMEACLEILIHESGDALALRRFSSVSTASSGTIPASGL